MFDWRMAVFAAFMIVGLVFVVDIALRYFMGKPVKAYALIVPLYWAAFHGFVKLFSQV